MNANRHDNLRGGTRSRIASLRAYVRRWNENPRHITRLESIHQARSHGVGKIDGRTCGTVKASDGNSVSVPVSVVDGWRTIGKAHDIVSYMNHSGWYIDASRDETIAGEVWQLPARNGSPVYVAGYRDGESGYYVMDASRGNLHTYADKYDAARAADALAESDAEDRREYDERLQEADGIYCDMNEKKSEAARRAQKRASTFTRCGNR